MMKLSRHAALLAVVRLLFSAAHAATATPAAATNYLFTTPLRPAHIHGLVMGSPPAYYVPRSEDFDWLNEAITERWALMAGSDFLHEASTVLRPEFGKWSLAETNRFHKWVTAVDAAGVTNVVVGYNLVTNSPPTLRSPGAMIRSNHFQAGEAAGFFWNPDGNDNGSDGYLDPDAPLVSAAQVYEGAQYTNIYSLVVYTNGFTNATSTLTMPMTNGTVSVHSNHWTAIWWFPAEHTYTNVLESSLVDACHAAGGMFPGYTNVLPFVAGSEPEAFSNDYVALRGAVRLADQLLAPTNAPAKWVTVERQRGASYTNDLYGSYAEIAPWIWTNATSSVSTNLYFYDWCRYEFSRSHQEWERTVFYEETNAVGDVEIKSEDVTEYAISASEVSQLEDTAVFETRFLSDAVTTGDTMRVEVEAMYAAVFFSYDNHCTTNYEDRVEISSNVVVRLAGPALDVSGTNATVKILINARAICEAAARAAGAPAPPPNFDGTPGAQRTESWSITRIGFVLFYRTHPTSKLDGW